MKNETVQLLLVDISGQEHLESYMDCGASDTLIPNVWEE